MTAAITRARTRRPGLTAGVGATSAAWLGAIGFPTLLAGASALLVALPGRASAADPKKPVRVQAAVTVPSKADETMDVAAGDGEGAEITGDQIVGGEGWQCPLAGARFTDDWGNPRSGGRRHQGTDLFAGRGLPVVAPVAGTARSHESVLGGHTVYLSGDDGVEYFFAHLDGYGRLGRVGVGEAVGVVGDSGNAKGTPHLHFEVHPTRKTRLNPFPTLAQFCR